MIKKGVVVDIAILCNHLPGQDYCQTASSSTPEIEMK